MINITAMHVFIVLASQIEQILLLYSSHTKQISGGG